MHSLYGGLSVGAALNVSYRYLPQEFIYFIIDDHKTGRQLFA